MRKCFSCRERIWSALGYESFHVLYLSLNSQCCLMPRLWRGWLNIGVGSCGTPFDIHFGSFRSKCCWRLEMHLKVPSRPVVLFPIIYFIYIMYFRRLNLMWLGLPKSFFCGFSFNLGSYSRCTLYFRKQLMENCILNHVFLLFLLSK